MSLSATMNEISNRRGLKPVKRLIVGHVRVLEQSVANSIGDNTASIGPIARALFRHKTGAF